jgi:hypothetical protein
MAVADITRIKKKFNAACDLADTYTATPDGGSRAYEQQIVDIAIDVDAELIMIGLNNPLWAHRIDFQASTTVAHGGNIPAHIGAIDAILVGGEPASPAPLDQITSERQLVSQSITVDPHYNLNGTVLAHNGASAATVKYCNFTRSTTLLQINEAYEAAVFRGLMSLASSPEGESLDSLGEYRAQYQLDKQMMANGQLPPPYQQ